MSADGFPLLRPLTHIPVSESPMPSIGEPKGIKGNGRIGQTPFAIPALGSPGSNFPGRMP
jgi:hypothetical protein